jgi:hypothetical protein
VAAEEEQGEVYFPAPANDEQRLVVDRLRRERRSGSRPRAPKE